MVVSGAGGVGEGGAAAFVVTAAAVEFGEGEEGIDGIGGGAAAFGEFLDEVGDAVSGFCGVDPELEPARAGIGVAGGVVERAEAGDGFEVTTAGGGGGGEAGADFLVVGESGGGVAEEVEGGGFLL